MKSEWVRSVASALWCERLQKAASSHLSSSCHLHAAPGLSSIPAHAFKLVCEQTCVVVSMQHEGERGSKLLWSALFGQICYWVAP